MQQTENLVRQLRSMNELEPALIQKCLVAAVHAVALYSALRLVTRTEEMVRRQPEVSQQTEKSNHGHAPDCSS